MNLTDFLIIYLACGAPFGVYYFLQNRTKFVSSKLWLNTFFNFAFWIPIAFRLLRENKFLNKSAAAKFDTEQGLDATQEKKLNLIQKQLEQILQKSSLKISIYEFRETIDRYIGLTFANKSHSRKGSLADKEFFRISENENVELAAICLYRRNQKRLSFHHIGARQDFLHFINHLSEFSSDKKTIGNLAVEFVKILNDLEAQPALEKMFIQSSQTDKHFTVKQLEKDLWNTEIHKPLPINQISTRLQTMTATANLRGKD